MYLNHEYTLLFLAKNDFIAKQAGAVRPDLLKLKIFYNIILLLL